MVSSPPDSQQITQPARRPLVIAHRGASGLAPENTLAAFALAAALGSDGIELDVRLSADGWPVVIHDARVHRTTGATGRVAALTRDSIVALNAGTRFRRKLAIQPRIRIEAQSAANLAFNGKADQWHERVPTLTEVLDLIRQTGLRRVYVELKTEPESHDLLLERTVSLSRQAGSRESITLLSFDHEVIRRAKQIAPEFRTAATFPVGRPSLAAARLIVEKAKAAGADEAALHFSLASKVVVQSLHEAGLAISVWTVNNRLLMRRLVERGVDSIMTNFPNRLIDTLNRPVRRSRFLGHGARGQADVRSR